MCSRAISVPEAPLRFGPTLSDPQIRSIAHRMALQYFKWDAQVGDTATLFRQPLLLRPGEWRHLSKIAEALADELTAAEMELVHRPQLYPVLGLPNSLQKLFNKARYLPPVHCPVRTLRFDFHYTTEGWRISEVNSDVPGGYAEAARFTELVAECCPGKKTAGDPALEWTKATISALGENKRVALLSAPGFLEDQQVTAFLSSQLQSCGVETFLVHHPSQLDWKDGRAFTRFNGGHAEMAAVVRFYQGEWLARAKDGAWMYLMLPQTTLVLNPGSAILTESKRFPLTWPSLRCKMSTWELLMPECRDPREKSWLKDESWVVKATFSNNGDEVHTRDTMPASTWLQLCSSVKGNPDAWVVQKRFDVVPVASHLGPVYPCVGVYTINGRTAGVYARASLRPLIDYSAMDVALLIDEKENA